MNRDSSLAALLWVSFCVALLLPTTLRSQDTAATGKQRRPNILLLMTDQHRPDALGCFSDPYARTPHLDRLAKEGVALRQAYCSFPLCVPSRASMLLGRYAHATGVLSNNMASPLHLPSFTQQLRAAGYRAACFGKLHVHERGDQDWDELAGCGNAFPKENKDGKDKPGRFREYQLGEEPTLGLRLEGGKPFGLPAPYSKEAHMEWQVKERVVEFLKTHRDKPWFVQCSFLRPHAPFQPPREYWDLYRDTDFKVPAYPADDLADTPEQIRDREAEFGVDNPRDDDVRAAMRGYYGCLAFCDAMLGEVLKALDDLGERGNTLVIYTSDHGEMLWEHRLWHKQVFFDQAVRVPLIFSMPGTVQANVQSRALVEQIDLFPTLMDLTGLEVPKSVQGRSLWPLLRGQTDRHRDVVRSENVLWGKGMILARMQFDGRYKLIDNGPDHPPELYDLKEDPREIDNLAARPEHEAQVKQIRKQLALWGREEETKGRWLGNKNEAKK